MVVDGDGGYWRVESRFTGHETIPFEIHEKWSPLCLNKTLWTVYWKLANCRQVSDELNKIHRLLCDLKFSD